MVNGIRMIKTQPVVNFQFITYVFVCSLLNWLETQLKRENPIKPIAIQKLTTKTIIIDTKYGWSIIYYVCIMAGDFAKLDSTGDPNLTAHSDCYAEAFLLY